MLRVRVRRYGEKNMQGKVILEAYLNCKLNCDRKLMYFGCGPPAALWLMMMWRGATELLLWHGLWDGGGSSQRLSSLVCNAEYIRNW